MYTYTQRPRSQIATYKTLNRLKYRRLHRSKPHHVISCKNLRKIDERIYNMWSLFVTATVVGPEPLKIAKKRVFGEFVRLSHFSFWVFGSFSNAQSDVNQLNSSRACKLMTKIQTTPDNIAERINDAYYVCACASEPKTYHKKVLAQQK